MHSLKTATRLVLIVAAIITPPLWWLHHTLTRGKIRGQVEMVALQKVQRSYLHDTAGTQLVLHQQQGFHIAGFPANNVNNRIWVLLDPQSEPFFKQIPIDTSFTINEKELKEVMNFCTLHPEVAEELKKRVVNPKISSDKLKKVAPPVSNVADPSYPSAKPSCS